MLNQALKNKKNRIREGGVEIKPLQGSKARQKMTRKWELNKALWEKSQNKMHQNQ